MCPLARAASKTASILARSLDAVSGIDCHIGCNTERTASVSTSSTDSARSGFANSVSVIRHCALCFSLRHTEALAARSSSAHWLNVGFPALRCLADRRYSIGLTPAATNLRAASALSRTVVRAGRETVCKGAGHHDDLANSAAGALCLAALAPAALVFTIPYVSERPRGWTSPGLPPVIMDPQQFEDPVCRTGPEYRADDLAQFRWRP
jgi:hypothetical protein